MKLLRRLRSALVRVVRGFGSGLALVGLGVSTVGASLVPEEASGLAAGYPPVPVPSENPITDEKTLLGKILFWDEQLSSDDTVACGTCHAFRTGGADSRREVLPGPDGLFDTADDIPAHPGPDGIFGNADDMLAVHPGPDGDFNTTEDNVRGSMGVVRRDVNGDPVFDALFGFGPQVTPRTAMNLMGGNITPRVLWDGRAEGAFEDPENPGTVLIADGAGLENQAVETLLNPVEMAKESRTPADVVTKIENSVPWAQNTDFPTDAADWLAIHPSYADLYAAAFGDSDITLARTAMAIATYIRTLVPDQTPFDNGANFDGEADFEFSNCSECHEENNFGPGPTQGNNFTDDSFRFLGLRPMSDDPGTTIVDDDGRVVSGAFKVPTLRNAGLKLHFNHTGQFTTLEEVVAFYVQVPKADPLADPELPVGGLTAGEQADVIEFIVDGLTDPRVAAEEFPFDSPTMLPEPSGVLGLLAGSAGLLALGHRRRGSRKPRRL